MQDERWPSLPAMLFAQAAKFQHRPLLWSKIDGAWVPHHWDTLTAAIRRAAASLIKLGIKPGDRVALISETRPDWIIAHFGIIACGAISVPGYATHSIADYHHLLSDSGARAVIVSTAAILDRVLSAIGGTDVETVIGFDLDATPPDGAAQSWTAILNETAEGDGQAVDTATAALQPDDTVCLIYTSGTGGTPKGVMLSHRNILSNCAGAEIVLRPITTGTEIFLSFLPLNHAYEHMAGVMLPISLGAEIYLSQGAESLGTELVEVKPTIMTAVPRLFETLHRKIANSIDRTGGMTAKLFQATYDLGVKRYKTPELVTWRDRILDLVYDRVVRNKVRARFGGRLKALVSGGGPLHPEVGLYFMALGVRVLQGYGQTESSPVVSVTLPLNPRIETVGPPLDRVEISFAADGEILIRGPLVMKGYWNDPEATARALEGGWLHTGDVGLMEADGQLRITDRKRDFIKNAGGEMIAPQRVEGTLTMQEHIAQAMVFGDRQPYLVAVLVPSEDLKRQVPEGNEVLLRQHLGKAVAAANQTLSAAERIRRFTIAPEAFTLENGQMTPTLKVKRNVVREVYRDSLEALYMTGRTRESA